MVLTNRCAVAANASMFGVGLSGLPIHPGMWPFMSSDVMNSRLNGRSERDRLVRPVRKNVWPRRGTRKQDQSALRLDEIAPSHGRKCTEDGAGLNKKKGDYRFRSPVPSPGTPGEG